MQWVLTTLGAFVAANVVPGIHCDSWAGLLVASLLLGILHAVLRPILILLALPLMIVTLGLFTLLINGFLVYLVSWLVRPFHVDGFWAAFWGGLVISVVAMVTGWLSGSNRVAIQSSSRAASPQATNVDKGSGPVIDV